MKKNIFTRLFGHFQWEKPHWLHKSAKGLLVIPVLLIFCILGGYWYQSLPRPDYVTADISIPDITPNAEILSPKPLILRFGIQKKTFIKQSVAPLQLVNKPVPEGIRLNPKIKGQWYWNGDNELWFNPEEDWPAAETFSIHFAPDAFAQGVKMETHNFSFQTKAFEAKIREFKFYQNPKDLNDREAVLTLDFNFPVSPESLEKYTSLYFEKDERHPIPFNYIFDTNKRVAYLHSQTIDLQKQARYLVLNLNKNIHARDSKAHLQRGLTQHLLIPDISNFLKITAIKSQITRNDKDRPEQILTIETSIGVTEAELNQALEVYLLPLNHPATPTQKERANYPWQNPGEVTDSILALSLHLEKESIPTEFNYSNLHSYRFKAQTPRYLYVKINKCLKGFGGFRLNRTLAEVIPVPTLPQEISFLHKGSLLALSGEKKFSVLVRGLPAVKFDFARVLPGNVNQLVTQTQGDFNNPYFINPSFNQQNISQIFSSVQTFDDQALDKAQYTALDLGPYFNEKASSGPRGLFLLQATGWDVQNKVPLEAKASRLILMTDLGLLVKDNADGSHDVFVQSITEGSPLPGVSVSILGKNGLEILSRTTDKEGQASFPILKDFVDDREPTAYLASLKHDVSFIPFHNEHRQLNYSKFDVGGLYRANAELNHLSAYLFSDRGLYRPGDTIHVGMIVKEAYGKAQTAGLPLQATLMDPRGNLVKTEKLVLNTEGYLNLDFKTSPLSPTGQYRLDLSLMKDDVAQNFLGTLSLRLAEFLPDRMRIHLNLEPKPLEGWSSPKDLKARVKLMNLYGAPASKRRIATKILLKPEKISFKDYPDYVFIDPLDDPKQNAKVFSESLNETKTNEKGEAELPLNLNRFDKASYQLTVFAEGFEAEGGRSVSTQTKALISPNPYFVGYKADGDLSFIRQNSSREISYLALNPQLNKESLNDLKIQQVSLRPVSTLVKKADGTYQYQSIIQSSIISTKPFKISAEGTNYTLPAGEIGDFALLVLNKDNTPLSQLKYTIVGESQRPLAKNAQLSIKLNKPTYKPLEDIDIQITAPYTGSGLITIERDKVYALKWFKSETQNSVQRIRIPADLEGNAYVFVAFIRDWSSPELFMNPLSYSLAPFDISHENREIQIHLKTPETARPGEPLSIDYQTNKPAKLIVFAVDEGILSVNHFQTPDPLAFFFQKNALEVSTQQTLDQILPKFILDRELSAAGGDGGEAELDSHLNPFKRKTDLPVVFWSGLIDSNEQSRRLTYQVPDYFNGSLRVMAVAASTNALGSTDTSTKIRGDFIINPNVPTFVAPQDEFEITASIANNVNDSDENAVIQVEVSHSDELELLDKIQQRVKIAPGTEGLVRYKFRAKSKLGSASITLKASLGNKTSSISSTLSLRPASPLMTQLDSGLSEAPLKNLSINPNLYPKHRLVEASLSNNPMILVLGLQRYLDNFPFGCTEQLVSKALPWLALKNHPELKTDAKALDEKINTTIQVLSQRQRANGSFSYWPGFKDHEANSFISIYAMQFLTEAKQQGFEIPTDLFANGLHYLDTLAGQRPKDEESARLTAYAIYVLTSNEILTSNYLANLEHYLGKNWQEDLTGVYIAAAYQLLKSEEEAARLIARYKIKDNETPGTDFFDGKTANAQFLYILAKHFPKQLKSLSNTLLLSLIEAMNTDEINTIFSGYASLALSAYDDKSQGVRTPSFFITEHHDNQSRVLTSPNPAYQKQQLGPEVNQITLNNPDKQTYFYQLMETGFDRTMPTKPLNQGLEIFREYRDATGHVINETALGSDIEVHLKIRALNQQGLSNIAIVDLLPGGFEVIQDSVKALTMDYFDVREDRVNFFGFIDSSTKELIYKIKAVNPGHYQVPPAFAQAMYNPKIKAQTLASEIRILNALK